MRNLLRRSKPGLKAELVEAVEEVVEESIETSEPVLEEAVEVKASDFDADKAYSDYIHGKSINDIAEEQGVSSAEILAVVERG